MKKNKAGISELGPVRLITLLYFISKGKWPIYDKYASIALKTIESTDGKSEMRLSCSRLISDSEMDVDVAFGGFYQMYIERLNAIFDKQFENHYKKCLEEKGIAVGEEYRHIRDVDRALWVYGHMFNDTKTNQKRMDRFKS